MWESLRGNNVALDGIVGRDGERKQHGTDKERMNERKAARKNVNRCGDRIVLNSINLLIV